MKVVAYPADRFACGHYRVAWPAQAAAELGVDVVVVPPGTETGLVARVVNGRAVSINQAPECDVIILQRPARRIVADMVPLLRAVGIAVVVDIDDDLERIHPSNPAFHGMHPSYSPDYNWEHLRRSCKEATLVTVSTPALMPRYGSHGRVQLIRNFVPEKFLSIPHDVTNRAPGWAGSLHSHPDDLRQAASALFSLHGDGHKLKFVGPRDGLEEAIGAELDDDACTGNLPFGDWMSAVAERIGVGAAPLADTSFNAAKSWLKPLEYAAVGIPWVASDTSEYRRLAKLCGTRIATRPREWYREMRVLVENDKRRMEVSEEVREAARKLTIEKNVHLWIEAWQAAMADQRKAATKQ